MTETIGRERGWPPASRARFEAECGPSGAYLIGSVPEVVDKAVHVHDVLGGVSRLTFQMTNVALAHSRMLSAIDLLGREVAPRVRERLAQRTR